MFKKMSLQPSTWTGSDSDNSDDNWKSHTKDKKRKSFDIRNLWFYLRSPSKRKTSCTINNSSSTSIAGSSGSGGPFRKLKQRNSSIPENVLLGISSHSSLMIDGSSVSAADLAKKEPRHSVPTIIQKDKAQKTWERMMKLKNDQKKDKRKKQRLLFKSNQSTNEDGNNKNSKTFNNNNVNVVVIIDDSSPVRTLNDNDSNITKEYEEILRATSYQDRNWELYNSPAIDAIVPESHSIPTEIGIVSSISSSNPESATTVKSSSSYCCLANKDSNTSSCCSSNNSYQQQEKENKRKAFVVSENNRDIISSNSVDSVVAGYFDVATAERQQQQQQSSFNYRRILMNTTTITTKDDSNKNRKISLDNNTDLVHININPYNNINNANSEVFLKQQQNMDSAAYQNNNNNNKQPKNNNSNSETKSIETVTAFPFPVNDFNILESKESSNTIMTTDPIRTTGMMMKRQSSNEQQEEQEQQQQTQRQTETHSINKNRPESCSSYGSFMNNEKEFNNSSVSLYEHDVDEYDDEMDGVDVFNPSMIDPRLIRSTQQSNTNTNRIISNNYQRKHSLAVPGEPRYISHRRDSSGGGSRSPLNSSCGGLSPSELSTPSPSCSNSINDDQSSYSSHSIHEAISAMDHRHHKHCTLSVDSLLLKSHINQSTSEEIYDQEAINQLHGPFRQDLNNNNNSSNSSKKTQARLVDELCRNFINLKTSSGPNNNNESNSRRSSPGNTSRKSNTTVKSAISKEDFNIAKNNDDDGNATGSGTDPTSPVDNILPEKRSKKRKNSMTAILASLLLPESICEKFGASWSWNPSSATSPSGIDVDQCCSDGDDAVGKNVTESKRDKRTSIYSIKASKSTSDQLSSKEDDSIGFKNQQQRRPTKRKGSIAQLTSASAGRIARLLRRTHSAGNNSNNNSGNNKESPPSYALFLSGDMPPPGSRHKSSKSRKKRRTKDTNNAKRNRKSNNESSPQQNEDSSSFQNGGNTSLEDMKQRLRFLSRRHTDSSLHSSTVRPSKDEVEKWSKSFRDLMANRYGSALFRAFLCREYSDENIEFWLACEEYRKIRSSKLRNKAKKIYDNYVAVRSPREVNLDHQLRSDIQRNLASASKHTFDEAQKKIQSLLESDSYVRFLQSDLYTDLVMSELKRKISPVNTAATIDDDNNKSGKTSRRESIYSQTPSSPPPPWSPP